MKRKDDRICELTLRVLELEDEVAGAWAAAEHYEIGETRLAERCLEAEGREASADEYASIMSFAHTGKRAEWEPLAAVDAAAE